MLIPAYHVTHAKCRVFSHVRLISTDALCLPDALAPYFPHYTVAETALETTFNAGAGRAFYLEGKVCVLFSLFRVIVTR